MANDGQANRGHEQPDPPAAATYEKYLRRHAAAHMPAKGIADRSDQVGGELLANIYLSEEAGKIIVVATYILGPGFYLEQSNPLVLPFATAPEELGRQAVNALLAGEAKKPPDLRALKRSDAPAFKASKAKSLKQFEAAYIVVSLATINASLRMECYSFGDADLFVGSNIAPGNTYVELAHRLMALYRGRRLLQTAR